MELLEAAGEGNATRVEQLVSSGASVEVTDDQGLTPLMWAARNDHLDVVRFLVEHGASVDVCDNEDWTPLFWPAKNGHLDMVQFLVEHGAAVDVRNNRGSSPLVWAARGGHLDVVRFLVEHGAAISASDSDGWTPLRKAAEKGRLDMARYLVERGAIVDSHDNDGSTPLVLAAENGHLDMVQFLVKHGADVDAHDNDGRTPLILAVEYGYLDMARFLVERGAAVDVCNLQSWTPLMWAASHGYLDMARFLVEHGAVVDGKDDNNWTPLMRAVRLGYLDVVRFLVERGAAVNACNSQNWTPLMTATSQGHLDIARILVEHGAVMDTDNYDSLMVSRYAAEEGLLKVVRFLVERGAVVDSHGNNGSTLLRWAANNGHLDMVQFLVEHGADVDAHDNNYGWTPLMSATSQGHMDIARLLVEHGAAVDAHDNDGLTPILWAADGGHLDMLQFFMDHGAAVEVCNNKGTTPLMGATSRGHLDIARFLMEHGAVVDARDKHGRTSLIMSAENGHLDMARFLVERGADVDAHDNQNGSTPLILAAEKCHLDMVQFLVERGAAVDAHDNAGRTPLMRAAENGNLDVVRSLVKHGAVVDAHDNDGWTPLMRSAEYGHLDMMQFFVEHGADVDAHDKFGRMSLMKAAEKGHLDVVQFLVERGADANTSDNEGWTPLMWAASHGYLDMVQFLVERGAAVDASDNDDWTPLMWATQEGHLEMLQFLVDHGADVDAHDNDDWTPLMGAACGGHLDMVCFLMERGVAVNASDNDGKTPLVLAAEKGHLDVVRFLVEREAVVDAHDNDGRTPLLWAAEKGYLDMVQFLVKHGADSNLKSTAGDSVLSIATKFGRQEIVQFLLPLVRYQDRRTQTEPDDEHVARHSNIPTSWLIPPFEVEVEPFVDGGNIGGDYRGKWLDADVVVKLFVDDASSATFIDEVCLWHQLRHPNVLKLYGVCNSYHHLFVCEYASNGSLPDYLKECEGEHQTPWKFLYEAALGLEYLHERNIIHGNLRGSNILIGSDDLAKLSGFRLSMSSSEGRWYASGDWVRWASPESLKGEQITLASDVYSFGMCIIEAVSGKVPFHMHKESKMDSLKRIDFGFEIDMRRQLVCTTVEQQSLFHAICHNDPHKRLQMQAVVNKLEQFAEIEAAKVMQHTTQPEPEPLVSFDGFDEINHGKTASLWTAVQTLVAQSENDLYRQFYFDLESIHDALNSGTHPWSTLQRFHGLLSECRLALDAMSQQNRVYRLSATRARDFSVQGLHRRISQLLQYVCPQDQDVKKRETEWKRLCREQVEVFVSEASEACVMLSSVDSEEDRSALVAVLRAELRNSDGKYTEQQLTALQKAHDDIVSKSFEDTHFATTPEWFIPWFELEMNEMATLGEGGFGSVIKAKWLDSEVVVKKLEIADKDAADVDKKREVRQMFEREVNIWFGLSHPHVVRLFGACHVGRPFFVCELAPYGTLDEYLRRHPDEIWVKLREAALGVQYLHARGIVHGDLKGNNIMIGSDGKAKVTDFGLSGMFGDDSTDFVVSGAWHWVAPECILGQQPTIASDVYSFAMCIIEALRVTNGDEYTLPWVALPNAAVKFHVTRRHRLPPRPQNCSDEAWILIERMCKSTPTDRTLIMTVVDELEKLADRHGDISGETGHIVSDIGKIRLSSSPVADELAEVKDWVVHHDTNQDREMDALTNIYQLLWDRLELVATQVFPNGEVTDVNITTISDFNTLVEYSKQRTRAALDITGVISLIKFTELALGGYALHRRLDKFMAAHAVPKDSSSLHNWTPACSTFMEVSKS